MSTQTLYGDVIVKGKLTPTPGTSSGEAATKGQVDAAQSTAVARANHTGTQLAATISDLTAVIEARIALLVGAAPGALDTLVELAAAITADETAATTLAGRVTTLEGASSGAAYKATVGDGAASSYNVDHNLGTTDVLVEVFETTGNRLTVHPVITRPSTNRVTVDFSGYVPATGSHRVVVRTV